MPRNLSVGVQIHFPPGTLNSRIHGPHSDDNADGDNVTVTTHSSSSMGFTFRTRSSGEEKLLCSYYSGGKQGSKRAEPIFPRPHGPKWQSWGVIPEPSDSAGHRTNSLWVPRMVPSTICLLDGLVQAPAVSQKLEPPACCLTRLVPPHIETKGKAGATQKLLECHAVALASHPGSWLICGAGSTGRKPRVNPAPPPALSQCLAALGS